MTGKAYETVVPIVEHFFLGKLVSQQALKALNMKSFAAPCLRFGAEGDAG